MEEKDTDKELLDCWLKGDEKAFERLFQRYIRKLHLFAAKQIGDRQLAEELVMDVMLRFWQNKESCRVIHSVSAYLYSAVKHTIIDQYRKSIISTDSLEDTIQEPLAQEQADTLLIDKEYQFVLGNGIKQLSPQRRLVFMLKREKDLSNKEIAERLNLSVKTVELHMTAAISFLRSYVNQQVSMISALVLLFQTLYSLYCTF